MLPRGGVRDQEDSKEGDLGLRDCWTLSEDDEVGMGLADEEARVDDGAMSNWVILQVTQDWLIHKV